MERKGERRREPSASFDDLRSFVGQNSSSKELKFIYSTRATRGYQKKKKGFH